MNAKLYLTVAAILAAIFGIGFLLIPANLLVFYGTPNPDGHIVLTAQYFGTALLGFGLLAWAVRSCPDGATLRNVLIANVIADVIGFVVTGWGLSQGLLNAMGYSSLVIYGLLGLGALYLLMASPQRLTAASS